METLPLALGLLAGLLVTWALFALRDRARRRRQQRRADRGRALEADAPAMLTRAGYRVLRRHPEARYTWWIDGEARETALAADLLVERGGARYVVEVKSGRGVRAERRETRRQLLEYALTYAVDGVLLLDAEAGRLHEVAFERKPARYTRSGFVAGLVIGAVGMAAVALLLR